jgi:hypothetical protein
LVAVPVPAFLKPDQQFAGKRAVRNRYTKPISLNETHMPISLPGRRQSANVWHVQNMGQFMSGGHCRKYKILPVGIGAGWSVLVTREDGFQNTWLGFETKDQAEAWIAKEIAKRARAIS